MPDTGYIKLWRNIENSRVFKNESLLKLWIWCLCQANYKDRWVSVDIGKGSTEVKVPRGSFIFGRDSAARKLKAKPSSTWKRMLKLQNMQNLTIESHSHYSIVSITNWDRYQADEMKEEQPKEQPGDSQGTAREQPGDTYKKVKKEKKEKKERKQPCSLTIQKAHFEAFWEAYPRRVGKLDVKKWWEKNRPDEETFQTILLAIARWKDSENWTKDGGKYIPLPMTWLNRGGWDDEPPKPKRHLMSEAGQRTLQNAKEVLDARRRAGRYDSDEAGGVG